MNKKIIIGILITLLISIVAIWIYGYKKPPEITNPYTQEYTIGEVDIEKYSSISENFEIGADKNGYAVFKDPHKAFNFLKTEYASGLNLIKKQFNLGKLSNKNYKDYKKYGSQVEYDISDKEMQEAFLVSELLDIYENSFE